MFASIPAWMWLCTSRARSAAFMPTYSSGVTGGSTSTLFGAEGMTTLLAAVHNLSIDLMYSLPDRRLPGEQQHHLRPAAFAGTERTPGQKEIKKGLLLRQQTFFVEKMADILFETVGEHLVCSRCRWKNGGRTRGLSVCGTRLMSSAINRLRPPPTAAPAAPLLHLPLAAQRLATPTKSI